jgi:DNA polymerase III delta prime subunit
MTTRIVKTPRTKKEYISKRIQIIAEKKRKEIDDTFPNVLIDEYKLASGAKLRTKTEILETYKNNRYLPLSVVFDFKSAIIDIQDKNKWLEAKRTELKLQLDADVESLQESLWLGEADSDVVKVLKAFETKVYKSAKS